MRRVRKSHQSHNCLKKWNKNSSYSNTDISRELRYEMDLVRIILGG